MSRPDVIVIGCGVIGASIAYHLSSQGVSVLICDAARPAGLQSASWASAGGLRSQGRALADAPLTRAAAQRWPGLAEELEADLEARFGGHLHLAETEDELSAIDERVSQGEAAGIDIERVDRPRLRAIAPAVTDRALAGAYTPRDGQAHPGRTTHAFVAAAVRLGARTAFDGAVTPFLEGRTVKGVQHADGTVVEAGKVVIAAGAWSHAMLASLGLDLPLRWRGLQMLLSSVTAPRLAPTVTAQGRNLSLKQSPSGQFMVGGQWFGRPLAGRIATTHVDSHVSRQWSTAVAILPEMRSLVLAQHWTGIEAQSIDGNPFIGPAPLRNLYVATGFSNHGFQISPAVGAQVADEIANGATPMALYALGRAERFGPEERARFLAQPYLHAAG